MHLRQSGPSGILVSGISLICNRWEKADLDINPDHWARRRMSPLAHLLHFFRTAIYIPYTFPVQFRHPYIPALHRCMQFELCRTGIRLESEHRCGIAYRKTRQGAEKRSNVSQDDLCEKRQRAWRKCGIAVQPGEDFGWCGQSRRMLGQLRKGGMRRERIKQLINLSDGYGSFLGMT